MTASLGLACLWAVAASVVRLLPTRDGHRRRAAALVSVGIPVLGYVTWQNGPLAGLLVLAAGVLVLRWPVLSLGRWIVRRPPP